jgi:site-specific recombinase XerD
MQYKTTLTAYKKYLRSLKLRSSTLQNYIWHTEQFLSWLEEKSMTQTNLKTYYDFLLKKYPKIATINLHLVTVNKFLNFNKKRFRFDLLTLKEEPLAILTSTQLQKFLELPNKISSPVAIRDKALLELLYSTGLKIGQLVKLEKKYIDNIKQELIFNDHQITIPPLAWAAVEKYLAQRQDDNPWLFINLDRANKNIDKHLSVRSVERIISKYAQKLKPVLRINPQVLRNTLASNLKQEGAQIQGLKAALHFKTKVGAKNYWHKI